MSAISTAIRRLVGGEDDAAAGPVQAIWNGVVIASSARTVAFWHGVKVRRAPQP